MRKPGQDEPQNTVGPPGRARGVYDPAQHHHQQGQCQRGKDQASELALNETSIHGGNSGAWQGRQWLPRTLSIVSPQSDFAVAGESVVSASGTVRSGEGHTEA